MPTISVRVDGKTGRRFENLCENLKINKSEFLRECIKKLVASSNGEAKAFLQQLGFERKEAWIKIPIKGK